MATNVQKINLLKKKHMWNNKYYNPNIYELDSYGKSTYILFGVNWSAMGTQHPGKVTNYSNKMNEANKLAILLNNAKITRQEFSKLNSLAGDRAWNSRPITPQRAAKNIGLLR